jgi:hypothetical protein
MNIEYEIEKLKERVALLEQLLQNNSEKQEELAAAKEKTPRDKTRYMFEGKVLPKNRLVLAIVSKYVKDNNPDYASLLQAFDKSLQGSLGVVEKIENAQKITDAAKRYFLSDSILLKDGSEVVVCTQWGIFNIIKFIKQATMLGYKIEEI